MVSLRHINFVTDVTTTLQSITLAPGAGVDQIALKFNHVANSTNLTASFQYLSGGVATGSAVTFTQVAPVFAADAVDTQTWLRGGMVAFAPAFTDSNLGGSYGTLDVNQSGQWTYGLNNALASTQSLAQGQTAVDHFTVSVRDQFGATDTQSVDITVTGTNDAPVMQTPSVSRALVEDASAPNLAATGLAQFSDVDPTDAHIASASLVSSALSGGAALPTGLAALLQGAMSVQLVQEVSPGHGQFQWDFALANSATQFLAAGQTLTLAYNVNATDSFGASTTQVVNVTITGTNDAPVVSSGATANFAENGTGVAYQATATDVDGVGALSYALGGADALRFNINATTGAVSFNTAPNFEAPNDAGGNNVYDITVSASDGVNTSVAQAVAITVTDVVEAPPSLAGQSVIDLGSYGKLIAPVQVDGAAGSTTGTAVAMAPTGASAL